MLETGLIIMSVIIVGRYNRSRAEGIKKYVWGTWLTWLATLILCLISVRSGWAIVIALLGYIACYIIAGSGMKESRLYVESYEYEQQAREKRQVEEQVQRQIDAAVSAALAQQNAAASPDKQAKA